MKRGTYDRGILTDDEWDACEIAFVDWVNAVRFGGDDVDGLRAWIGFAEELKLARSVKESHQCAR